MTDKATKREPVQLGKAFDFSGTPPGMQVMQPSKRSTESPPPGAAKHAKPAGPSKAAISRQISPMQPPGNPLEGLDDLISMAESELEESPPAPQSEQPAEAPQAETSSPDITGILKKYGTKPEDIAKALLNEYKMRDQKDKQINMLLKASQTPQSAQAQPQSTQAPVMQQVTVNPFDKAKMGEAILERPAEAAEELLGHASRYTNQMLGPVYAELIEAKMFRKHPDIVTNESWPIIRAMANQSEGANIMDKLDEAVKQYREAWGSAPASTASDQTVEDMKQAAAQPSPKTRASGQKVYYQDEIERLIQRDLAQWRRIAPAVEKAKSEGRVMQSRQNPVPVPPISRTA